MPPSAEDRKNQLTSGFSKFPSIGQEFLDKGATSWLEAKRNDEEIGPYWRIHDGLYDLTNFIEKHPGGRLWIEETKGLDITEAFEASHITDNIHKILPKYFVKNINTQRLSPFTFEQNGFYQTLKRKAIPILKKDGPQEIWKFQVIQDSLFYGFLATSLAATYVNSQIGMIVAGILLCFAAAASHNYFHQRDNWRMYIMDFTAFSSREWRITHGLSHHMFANTIYDFDLALGEPYFSFVPSPDKSFLKKYGMWPLFPVTGSLASLLDLIRRFILIYKGKDKILWPLAIVFIELVVFAWIRGSLMEGLWMWLILQMSCSMVFCSIGLTVGHYNTDLYMELDKSLENKDWGLHQVSTSKDRSYVVDSLFLTAISFGNHILHHLFPTVDHACLPLLKNVFIETCEEFNLDYDATPWYEHVIKMVQQAARSTPRKQLPNVNHRCGKL